MAPIHARHGLSGTVTDGSRHDPFCSVLAEQMSEPIASVQIEEKNAFSRQSRVHWDCLPTARDRNLSVFHLTSPFIGPFPSISPDGKLARSRKTCISSCAGPTDRADGAGRLAAIEVDAPKRIAALATKHERVLGVNVMAPPGTTNVTSSIT